MPAQVGIVMLDADIPRPLGDVGNPQSYPFAVEMAVCQGATSNQVVEHAAGGLVPALTETARMLERNGVRAVSTCCGFLAIHQRELAAALHVPVATSSLLQVPMILQMLQPDQLVGVVTANGSTLGNEHLAAVGIGEHLQHRVQVIGLEKTQHLYPVLMGKNGHLDQKLAEDEVLLAVRQALKERPRIGAFVMECTNLPPYSEAVRTMTGLPVWDALSMIRWLKEGLQYRQGS